MSDKLSVDQLLRMACMYADQDRAGFLAAYAHMPNDEAAVEAREFLGQLRAYRRKRWGKPRDPLAGCVLKTLDEIRADHNV